MTVSVAMATYNGGRYLAEQLSSLAEQRQLPDELVVTDDGSRDNTLPIIEAFALRAPFPVRVVRNDERLGYRANFMRAASLCRSDLIAFCDQDDIWAPQKLSTCTAAFDDPEVLLVYHDALTVSADGRPLAPLEQFAETPLTPYLAAPPMSYTLGLTQVFRRSLVGFSAHWSLSRDHKQTDRQERMAHDQWVYFLASVFGSIVHINQPLTLYRQHSDNRYGYAAPSWFRKLTWSMFPSFSGRAEQFAALENGACSRAAILERLAETLTGEWRRRAIVGGNKYRRLEHLYHGRRRLYEEPSFADRAAAVRSILERQGYRPKRNWGLGSKALVGDLLLGLPVGHRLSKPRKMVAS